MFRRRRQAILIGGCLIMGIVGSVAGALARVVFPPGAIPGGAASLKPVEHVLLVGIDDNYDPTGHRIRNEKARTDTLALVTMRPGAHSLHVLSIPRDTQVLIPKYGTDKINAAFSQGGIQATREVVEALLGVTVDHTLEVSLSGAAEFLDQLGGVDVYIEQPIHYEDHTAKLLIDFKPGWQKLDGASAVRFARFRHDAMGDIGRVGRQQAVMHAVEEKVLNPSNWWRLPQLATAAGHLFKSDLTAREFVDLANYARSKPAVSYTTLPGDFGYSGYWMPSHSRIAALMEGLEGKPDKADKNEKNEKTAAKTSEPSAVEVLYASKEEAEAAKLASRLSERGLTVVRTAPLREGDPTFTRVIGRNGNATLDPAVAGLVPHATWQLSDDPSPYTADYTVVVGPDYRE